MEWVAIFSSRVSSWPRDWTHLSCVSCTGRQFFTNCEYGCTNQPGIYQQMSWIIVKKKKFSWEDFPGGPVVKFLKPGSMSSIPGLPTQIPDASWCGQRENPSHSVCMSPDLGVLVRRVRLLLTHQNGFWGSGSGWGAGWVTVLPFLVGGKIPVCGSLRTWPSDFQL